MFCAVAMLGDRCPQLLYFRDELILGQSFQVFIHSLYRE